MGSKRKFRAWDKKSNCWYPIDPSDTFGIFDDENLVVEEFTDLNDKNGKEIYEGDIVKWNETIGFIERVNYRLGWTSGKTAGGKPANSMIYPNQKRCEVIGNIHENPELLKGSA